MRASDSTRLGSIHWEMSQTIRAYKAMGQVDVIHDHTLIGPLYAHRPGSIPTVTTMHGRLLPEEAEIYRAISINTSIIAISYDQIRLASDLNVAKVIHHGLDLSSVPFRAGKGGYACFLGRMCPDKGVREAVLIARSAGIPLRIAAKMREPAELEYFHEAVEPVLGPHDELVGEIGDAEKFELVGDAVALLCPIQWPEPFGLVMIEALATGTPVIGTRSGAAPEIVDDGITGFLAPVKELARLLPLAANLDRTACRAAVQERFSAARMVAEHLGLYRQILDGQE
jgi:glycosyltransferase involved in cell wall biosynthesis